MNVVKNMLIGPDSCDPVEVLQQELPKVHKHPTIVLEYVPLDELLHGLLILLIMDLGFVVLEVQKYLMQLFTIKHSLNCFLCQDNQLELGFFSPSDQIGNKMIMKRRFFIKSVDKSPHNFGYFPG
jgi:hypothetical protein